MRDSLRLWRLVHRCRRTEVSHLTMVAEPANRAAVGTAVCGCGLLVLCDDTHDVLRSGFRVGGVLLMAAGWSGWPRVLRSGGRYGWRFELR